MNRNLPLLVLLAIAALFGLALAAMANAQPAPPPSLQGAFLAGVALNDPTRGPKLLRWFDTRKECLDTATEFNTADTSLQNPQARQIGAEYVCLTIQRGGV